MHQYREPSTKGRKNEGPPGGTRRASLAASESGNDQGDMRTSDTVRKIVQTDIAARVSAPADQTVPRPVSPSDRTIPRLTGQLHRDASVHARKRRATRRPRRARADLEPDP